MKVYINGKLYSKEKALISVFDHGLLYGDGVFEGMRVYHNRIFKLKEHIDRLFESAKTIMLELPMSKKDLIDATVETVRENPYEDAYIRLVVTRGVGTLGLDPNKCLCPQVIIIVDKIVLYSQQTYEKGMAIITVATRRNLNEAVSPRVKSLNYLNNIMAKIEAQQSGYEEAIMLSQEGYISECTGDNIFIIKNQQLLTPSLHHGVLEGITRDAVMQLTGQMGLGVHETTLLRHDLFNADECFLTGTAAEVVPVVKIDGRVIGDGKPGAITRKIAKGFASYVKKTGVLVDRRVRG
ncbi:MAG: branched-chain-amino-acid transaminase [Chlamydiota bacterium]|nr:branched-chain-amino-acid transaminase [Chlamydiota bacterium]